MRIGDMIELTEIPWHQHAGEYVIVTRIDEDGRGFDFMIPESRGHSPMKFAARTITHFDDVENLRWKD